LEQKLVIVIKDSVCWYSVGLPVAFMLSVCVSSLPVCFHVHHSADYLKMKAIMSSGHS